MKTKIAALCVSLGVIFMNGAGFCAPTPYQHYEFSGSYVDSMGHWNMSPAGSPSVAGNSLYLDGSSHLISANVAGSPPNGISHNNFSVTGFFKVSELTATMSFFSMSHMAPYATLPDAIFLLFVRDDGSVQNLTRATSDWQPYARSAAGLVAVDTVYHFACVYDGSHNITRVYLNGTQVASSTHSYDQPIAYYSSTDQRMFIGAYNENNIISSPFTGYIDELKVYQSALTAQDVLDEYTLTSHDIPMPAAIPEPMSVFLLISSIAVFYISNIMRKRKES